MNRPDRLAADACYSALCSHDARFDGQFFTAVTSPGIDCRPVCRVRTPRRENCRFFAHAAQAERAGFRPCPRHPPELAPMERHWSTEGACGSASARRFNAAFLAQYRLNPTQLRRHGRQRDDGQGTVVRLSYRPPYDTAAMLAFLRQRQIEGLAFVDDRLRLGQTLRINNGERRHRGWLLAEFDATRSQLVLRVSDALRWPDAFPASDVALHKLLGLQDFKQPPREAEAASQAWKPWRSYAVVRAWSAGQASPTGTSA